MHGSEQQPMNGQIENHVDDRRAGRYRQKRQQVRPAGAQESADADAAALLKTMQRAAPDEGPRDDREHERQDHGSRQGAAVKHPADSIEGGGETQHRRSERSGESFRVFPEFHPPFRIDLGFCARHGRLDGQRLLQFRLQDGRKRQRDQQCHDRDPDQHQRRPDHVQHALRQRANRRDGRSHNSAV